MKFKYNNKIIETPNLEKKLKRMKLTIDLIEILLDEPKTIKLEDDTPEWEEKGLLKHEWKNENINSKEYKFTVVGFHKENEEIKKPEFLNDDWILNCNLK